MYPRDTILARLYYDLGKQATDYALQHSRKEGEDVIWTKRKAFLDLDPEKDRWFIQHCNHRQILQNEVIFDFDRVITKEDTLVDTDVHKLIAELHTDGWRYVVYHTGSKGVHVHIYFDGLILLSRQQREAFRTGLLKRYSWFANVDYQKTSDKTMIALEHTPHWRTGTKKTMIYNDGVESWN